MRIIFYFVFGLFLSLCTIPAFAEDCPSPFVLNPDNESCSYLGVERLQNNNATYEYAVMGQVSIVPGDPFVDWLLSLTSGSVPPGAVDLEFHILKYISGDVGVFDVTYVDSNGNIVDGGFFGLEFTENFTADWANFLAGGFYTPLTPSGSSPQAFFDIAGIKDNIFMTLLSIGGVLLLLIAFKYSWATVKKMFENVREFDEFGSYIEPYWRNHTVETKDIAPGIYRIDTYKDGVLEGSGYMNNNSSKGVRDWDNLTDTYNSREEYEAKIADYVKGYAGYAD